MTWGNTKPPDPVSKIKTFFFFLNKRCHLMENICYIQLQNVFQECASMIANQVRGFLGFLHPYSLLTAKIAKYNSLTEKFRHWAIMIQKDIRSCLVKRQDKC